MKTPETSSKSGKGSGKKPTIEDFMKKVTLMDKKENWRTVKCPACGEPYSFYLPGLRDLLKSKLSVTRILCNCGYEYPCKVFRSRGYISVRAFNSEETLSVFEESALVITEGL